MKRILILGTLVSMIGCGGSGGGDDGYTMPLDTTTDSPEVTETTPPEPTCIKLSWALPAERENGDPLDPAEIAYVLVSIEDTYTLALPEATTALTSKGTGVERLEQGDPTLLQFPWNTTNADCHDLALGEDNYRYWYAVMVVDTDGVPSGFSTLLRLEE